MRKMLSPAFSQRALLEQESIISDIVDKFVRAIGEKAHPESNGINMIKWFEMTAFDILGDMAFGESFHSVEAGMLSHYVPSSEKSRWKNPPQLTTLASRQTTLLG
jgi:cytochrome P450